MAATISEYYLSRKFELGLQAGRELVYDILGTDDETVVQALLVATVPPVYGGLALENIGADPVEVDSVSHTGFWKGYARYVRIDGDSEYTFDTGGGTTKITQSLATIASHGVGGFPAPDMEGAIGVTEDSVEGVEITTPAYQFTETHRFADVAVTTAYKMVLFRLTGRTNDAPFKGMATGECLFLGATGSKRGDEKWSITYRFAGSPNVTGLAVGPITGIDKDGWHYLWVRYADFEDGFALSLVKRPIGCYIEKVYEEGDFSTMGIGT